MNDVIKELSREATEDIMGVKVLNQTKFAELIVRECLDICIKQVVGAVGTYPSAHNRAIKSCTDSIKKYFGVE